MNTHRTNFRRFTYVASVAYCAFFAGPAAAGPHPFRSGEQLTFSLKFVGVKAGNLDLACYDAAPFAGRPTFRFEGALKTTAPFKWTYLVDDKLETVAAADTLVPIRTEMWIEEGRHKKHHKASFIAKPLAPQTHDFLSFLYALRSAPLAVGHVAKIKVWSEGGVINLPMIVREIQDVKSGVGTRPCFMLEPVNQLLMKGRPLQFSIAISNDAERLPLMFRGKASGVSVSAVLNAKK